MYRILPVLLALSALVLVACGGGVGMPKMPVDAAKALNATVTEQYTSANTTWENAKTNSGNIAKTEIDVTKLNVADFQAMMTECLNTAPEAIKKEGVDENKDKQVTADETAGAALVGYDSVQGCGTDKLDALSTGAEEDVAGFYKQKFQLVDELRKDLTYVLPTNIETMLKTTPERIKEVAEIRAEAEAALAAIEQNPMSSGEDKTKAKADYDLVISELDSAQANAEKILNDFKDIPAEAAGIATQVSTDIQNFGQAPAADGS